MPGGEWWRSPGDQAIPGGSEVSCRLVGPSSAWGCRLAGDRATFAVDTAVCRLSARLGGAASVALSWDPSSMPISPRSSAADALSSAVAAGEACLVGPF